MQAKEPDQSKEPGPRRPEPEPEPVAWWVMIFCVLAVGVIAGFGAVVFRVMIGGFHNLLFLGRWNGEARSWCRVIRFHRPMTSAPMSSFAWSIVSNGGSSPPRRS